MYPSVPYGWMTQRPQQIAYHLAKLGWEVIYMNERSVAGQGLPVPPGLTLVGKDINALKGRKIDVTYTISPLYHSYKGLLGEKLWVYDNVDNFSQFWKDNEVKSTAIADVLITTSEPLYKKKTAERNGNGVYLIRNGVNLDYFTPDGIKECPSDISSLESPIIGYVGAMAYWVDLKLIDYIGKALPDYNFVYVGPPFGIRHETDMKNRDNIRFLGLKAMKDIPSYINSFDVCIIPFLKNSITESANPLKLYEYMALGKPVVSTYMPEVELCQKQCDVNIGMDYDDFVNKVKGFIHFKHSKRPQVIKDCAAKRIAFARDNSWEKRAKMLSDILTERLNKV